MAITRSFFMDACVRQGNFFGVHPHFIAAVAQFRSAIDDGANGNQLGPYRISQEYWDANGTATDMDVFLQPEMINDFHKQCIFAALNARNALKQFIDRQGRDPNALELYQEQWPDDPVPVVADIQKALDDTSAEIAEALARMQIKPDPGSATIPDPDDPIGFPAAASSDPAAGQNSTPFKRLAPLVMKKLMTDFGLQDFQAAGILGNLAHECNGFRTFNEKLQPGATGPGGLGWAQWTNGSASDRRTRFEEYCQKNGLTTTSDAGNYGYLRQELQTTFKKSIDVLMNTTNFQDAVRKFEQSFEKAAANAKFYSRRENWAQKALDIFNDPHDLNLHNIKQLPPAVARLLDPDLMFLVVEQVTSGASTYWLIDQVAETGAQVLIQQTGATAKLLAQDSNVFPLPDGLVPPDVVLAFKDQYTPGGGVGQVKPPPQDATDARIAQSIFDKAVSNNGKLRTRDVPNTANGHRACAWAVNEIVRQAVGRPIDAKGGLFATLVLGKVLAAKHKELKESELMRGAIVISPTTPSGRVGHVGIVGEMSNSPASVKIYSNSSNAGVFRFKGNYYTLAGWKTEMASRGLPTRFYQLTKAGLGL